MSRLQPEGTRLLSRSDDRPDTYTYGAIKRESFLVAPRKYVWAKRDFVLISVALITALIIITVTLSLGLPRIAVNRARHLNATVSPSAALPPLEQSVDVLTTESSGVTVGKYLGSLLTRGRLNFQISPF